MTLLKGLTKDMGSRHSFAIAGRKDWPRPPPGQNGDWVELPQSVLLKPHYSGFHFTKENAAAGWCWERNFTAEVEGSTAESGECVVARKARLVEELFLSPEGWAALAVNSLHDVIQIPEEIGYPWDQVRAVLDPYNIVAEEFGLEGLQLPSKDGKRSPREYAASHVRQLIARCEADSKTTVEMGFNASGVLELAYGATRLLDLKKAGAGAADNWQIARDVSAHTRKAATQFALQAGAMGREEELPVSLRSIFRDAASDAERPGHSPVRIAELLMERQSHRLLKAWGIDPARAR